MQKFLSLILSAITLLSLSSISFAAEPTQIELSDEVLLSLSLQDFSDCYDYLLQYKEQNPLCTSETLDELASNFYVQRYLSKASTPSPQQDEWYDDYIMEIGNLNPDELALAKKYPSDLAAVGSSKEIATNEADSRDWGGAYLGNKDAFRHAAWNALIICRFYALQKGDFDWCLERTRLWTTAHETGASRPSDQSAAQFSVDQEMDMLNNAAGRAAAETTYTSEYLALQKVQQYVDNGWCKRIKTDAQTGYSRAQMLAIPTWTLRSTNTAGKN